MKDIHFNPADFEPVRQIPYIGIYVNSYCTALLKAVLESGYKAITEKRHNCCHVIFLTDC